MFCLLQLCALLLWVPSTLQSVDASASSLPPVWQGLLQRMLKPAQDDAFALQVTLQRHVVFSANTTVRLAMDTLAVSTACLAFMLVLSFI